VIKNNEGAFCNAPSPLLNPAINYLQQVQVPAQLAGVHCLSQCPQVCIHAFSHLSEMQLLFAAGAFVKAGAAIAMQIAKPAINSLFFIYLILKIRKYCFISNKYFQADENKARYRNAL
jgi:hypothetical protein